MTLDLAVQQACATPVPGEDGFRRWVAAALAGAGRAADAELALRLVGRDEMAALNARYRGRAGPTNVLSFPAALPAALALPLLGDIVICAPLVRTEAAQLGKGVTAHWAHLTVHGTLHLLGFDHQADAEARAMEALERRVLSGLGLPCPYTGERAEAPATP